MRYQRLFLLLSMLTIAIVGCKKDSLNKSDRLRNAMVSNDVETVDDPVESNWMPIFGRDNCDLLCSSATSHTSNEAE